MSFRIDYVFHTEHFQTRSVKVLDVTGSDHRLLVSELVPNQEAAPVDGR